MADKLRAGSWWSVRPVPQAAGALFVLLHASPVLAKQDCSGSLTYLGQTANQSRSVGVALGHWCRRVRVAVVGADHRRSMGQAAAWLEGLGVTRRLQRQRRSAHAARDHQARHARSLATPSAWSGTLRVGARALVARLTFVEFNALGQNGLRLWEGRLFLSHGF
jgi:hypothetical protein